ncbi:MAG: ATP-binding protein [Desulfobacteraceae bacterium]|nr:ATP-binding protein [Desulfobacteraceae bacterium]
MWGNDFSWTLNEDINVLIGKNASGKSTILRMLNEAVLPIEDSKLNFRLFDPVDEMIIELEDDIVIRANSENRNITGDMEITHYQLNTALINTFDVVEKSLNPNTTLLDYRIDKLKLEFITYQRDLSNQVEEAFKNDDKTARRTQLDRIEAIYETKNIFIKVLTELFNHTEKEFNEKAFHFLKTGTQTPILPENLSSGEKQVLIILLTTLLQNRKKYILLMDEPEISMHIDWQRSLIENIRQINPNCQIIIATHSPTVYYQGWIEKIARIEEIQSASGLATESIILIEKSTRSKRLVQKIKSDSRRFSGIAGLYQFNRKISAYTSFTKDDCIELLDFLKENKIYPDIITFSTLLGKAKNTDEIRLLEEVRNYYGIKTNDIYLNKLNFKR